MTVRVRLAAAAALAASAVLSGGAPPASAQDAGIRGTARRMLASYQDAVIHVKAAVKQQMSFGGHDMPGQDSQVEVLGTIIDPSGLTVLSESSLDPGGALAGLLGGGGDNSFSMKSDVGDVKMVLKDGKEVLARVVLRDKDLDLAFVAPEDRTLKFPFVPLEAGKAPEALDDVIIVSRLGRHLDRSPSVGLGSISAIVKKPRTFYAVESSGLSMGCPAFDAAGKLLGIFLQRRAPATGGGHGLGALMGLASGMIPVILPTDDVKEGAQQALVEAAKAPEKKPDVEGGKKEEAPAGEGEKKPEPPKEEPPKKDEPPK